MGKGNYFTSKPLDGSESYDRVIKAYLSIKNPFVYDASNGYRVSLWEQVAQKTGAETKGLSYDALQNKMRELGYDGVIEYYQDGSLKYAVTFDSAQIKSATDNIGTFDGNEPDIRYSKRVTDKDTLKFLDEQETITTYKAMQLIDGKLYPPMAAKVKGADGKYHLTNPSEIGVWQEAVEDPTNIKVKKNGIGYYTLNKGNGKSVDAAYNPYEHSSNLVLNDQFEEA